MVSWQEWTIVILALVFIVLGLLRARRARDLSRLKPQVSPALNYEEGLARARRLIAPKPGEPPLNPICMPQLLEHGRKMPRVIVLIHGFTNCPKQYERMANQLYEQGWNVLIPRIPQHGYADQTVDHLRKLTAEDSLAMLDEAINAAGGLGDYVAVSGISGGGTLAAWAGQFRPDVDLAVPVAPLFGQIFMPPWVIYWLATLALMLPNIFIWWDPVKKDKRDWGIPYAYPGFGTHGMAEMLRVAARVLVDARQRTPGAKALAMVTNAYDRSVDNRICNWLTLQWRAHGRPCVAYEFNKDLELAHDVIDPNQRSARIDLVYPVILDLINGAKTLDDYQETGKDPTVGAVVSVQGI